MCDIEAKGQAETVKNTNVQLQQNLTVKTQKPTENDG